MEAAIHAARLQRNLRLSDRQMEILREAVTGARAREIAEQLQISFHTVNAHLRDIYGKLGVRGRVEATLWYFAQFPAELPASAYSPEAGATDA